ncbi:PD-(D/E)XK motif protein [Listeria monocytogenes]|uniref:PD-(D/E)XK motif protein n=1 Tax=Listeria TaxID=1637 RepID=UPI000874C004|nr:MULTISPECIES: PD-(D/E)XK motif protein [Listeria]EAE0330328.1 PD-(D/E)XK motif protein [Listeria monocytogenes]EAE2386474.1 PD-(D/E)XK motif protein [Listeria monocytogenes]EAF9301456.1 PD-(D/E)XK motif protein [Listeria monocytogenes]EAG0233202.1 PD-(D/E)XK motif protein [Listeria monocytogenes]EGC7708594.1 PD-(D/E)XK motif protein [Listeria monocytogenes]
MKNYYKREEGSDIIGIYFGKDEEERYSLLIKLKECPKLDIKTNLLETRIGKRKDMLWALQVSLRDPKYYGVFRALVEDLVGIVKKQSNLRIIEKNLIKRFNEWQDLFSMKINNLLKFSQIQGLLGELFFLKEILFVRVGIEEALKSWIGPLGTNKDFQFERYWFEVKTKSEAKETITISNSEQLKSINNGYLTVIDCEKSSELDENAISLNGLHYDILKMIEEKRLRNIYFQRLFSLNFVPAEEYNNYYFIIKKTSYYLVDSSFPSVTVSDTNSIIKMKYDILLSGIKNKERNGMEVWKSEL